MKGGAENRRKTIIAGTLGAVALCCVIYGYFALFGGSDSAPAPTPAPVAAKPAAGTSSTGTTAAPATASTSSTNATRAGGGAGLGAIPGVDATKIANTSSSLDPTLDEAAMLRTEGLVYSGTGRNIFSLIYVPLQPVNIPTPPSPRPVAQQPAVQLGPPAPAPLPPINLKFFGTATRPGGTPQAFLLSGEDVYLASQGDIVAHKYKIVNISPNSIQVEDLSNSNTQTLPLQVN